MNPEIKICKCGFASMTYEVIGEDTWSGSPINVTLNKDGYGVNCICKTCGDLFDIYDPVMVKIFNHPK